MNSTKRAKYSLLIATFFLTAISYGLIGCIDAEATALAVSKAIAYQGTSNGLIDEFLDSESVFEQDKGWGMQYTLELENLGYSSVRSRVAKVEAILGNWLIELERMQETHHAFEMLVPPPGYSSHRLQVLSWMSAAIARRQQMIVYVQEYDRFTDMAGWTPGYTLEMKRQRGEEILHKLEDEDELPLSNEDVEKVGEYRNRQLEALQRFNELSPEEKTLRTRADEERRQVFQ